MKKYTYTAIAAIFMPTFAFAANLEYKLLSGGIPGLSNSGVFEAGNLSTLFNALFQFAILIGGVASVLIIATAGLQYMTSEAVGSKTDAKHRIQNALIGLVLLLATYIIFNQINPDINDIQLDLPNVQTSTTSSGDDGGATTGGGW